MQKFQREPFCIPKNPESTAGQSQLSELKDFNVESFVQVLRNQALAQAWRQSVMVLTWTKSFLQAHTGHY